MENLTQLYNAIYIIVLFTKNIIVGLFDDFFRNITNYLFNIIDNFIILFYVNIRL